MLYLNLKKVIIFVFYQDVYLFWYSITGFIK